MCLALYDGDRFCITPFSALEQTQCSFIACGSKRVTVAFFKFYIIARFEYPLKWCTCSALCCYMAGAPWNSAAVSTHALLTLWILTALQTGMSVFGDYRPFSINAQTGKRTNSANSPSRFSKRSLIWYLMTVSLINERNKVTKTHFSLSLSYPHTGRTK